MFGIPFRIPYIPKPSEWNGIIQKQKDNMTADVVVTIKTKNPNNRDVQKDTDTNLVYPCYKTEVRKSGDFYLASLFLHSFGGQPGDTAIQGFYHSLRFDRVLKRHYPDRVILIEKLEKQPEFDFQQLSSYALSEVKV